MGRHYMKIKHHAPFDQAIAQAICQDTGLEVLGSCREPAWQKQKLRADVSHRARFSLDGKSIRGTDAERRARIVNITD
jgi:hypothetical protein